jgi:hypothetical protein
MWGLLAYRRPARVSRAGRHYLSARYVNRKEAKQIRKMGSFHTSNIITLLCCWCPTSYGLLQSVRKSPYYFSSCTGIQLGHPCIENKIFKRVISRIDTKSSIQKMSSDTTTTNVDKINNLGSLLLSSTIGNNGSNKVQLILASQSPRRAGKYTSQNIYRKIYNCRMLYVLTSSHPPLPVVPINFFSYFL